MVSLLPLSCLSLIELQCHPPRSSSPYHSHYSLSSPFLP
ncbi:hypothetical protein GBAR_LOCUS25264, partial [Geodia barretti]